LVARAPTEAPVTFRGSPFGLAAVMEAPSLGSGPFRVSLKVPKGKGGPIEVEALSDEDRRVLRLTLPRFTPPGRYEGTVAVDGKDRPVVAEVEPELDVRLFPEQLSVRGHAGDLVGIDFTLINMSNVPVEIRTVHAFGMFMDGGVERAIRQAYTAKLKSGERRADVLVETLAGCHCGLVKLKVTKGAGTVEPDGVCHVEGVLHIPSGAEQGCSFVGNLEMHGLVYPIKIAVERGSKGGKAADEGDEEVS
jgi:hypothetical protein